MSKRARESSVSDNDEEDREPLAASAPSRRKCPYLDTISRQHLDFDNEKVCSVTLANISVYACLVCGKFFQGRGKASPAYTHSVQHGHFVFMNLHDGRSYCLPDGYEIVDSSIDDVKKCLAPTFTEEEVANLDANSLLSRDVYGVAYLPGFIGLNNLKATDYINVVLGALAHISAVRNFFLHPRNSHAIGECKSRLVKAFATVIAKMWSGSNFKSVVSPQEFVQEVSVCSKARFSIGQRSEVATFLVWLLQELHREIFAKMKGTPSFIDEIQGEVEVTTYCKQAAAEGDDSEGQWIGSSARSKFLLLNIDIPPCPLFKDSQGGAIIPQIPIFEVLKKFDGETLTDHLGSAGHTRKQYRLLTLPRYLILHIDRFKKNNFSVEKNPTIVTFPVKNLEMRDYYRPEDASQHKPSKYDLVACICHDSLPATQSVTIGSSTTASKQQLSEKSSAASLSSSPLASGVYRLHLQNKATKQWYELQDLHVAETSPQQIGLSEACLLVYELKE